MIVCPACGSATSVRETRACANYIRRRRVCDSTTCGKRVTTIEAAVTVAPREDVVILSKQLLFQFARAAGITPNESPPEIEDDDD